METKEPPKGTVSFNNPVSNSPVTSVVKNHQHVPEHSYSLGDSNISCDPGIPSQSAFDQNRNQSEHELDNDPLKKILRSLESQSTMIGPKTEDDMFFSNIALIMAKLDPIKRLECHSEIQSIVLKYAKMPDGD